MMHYECSYIFTVFNFRVPKRLAGQERCCERERIRKHFEDFEIKHSIKFVFSLEQNYNKLKKK